MTAAHRPPRSRRFRAAVAPGVAVVVVISWVAGPRPLGSRLFNCNSGQARMNEPPSRSVGMVAGPLCGISQSSGLPLFILERVSQVCT